HGLKSVASTLTYFETRSSVLMGPEYLMQQPTFSVHQHRPLFASLAVFTLITAMNLCQLFARDILQGIYVALALLVVFSTFILLLRPRAILCAALVYLASPV